MLYFFTLEFLNPTIEGSMRSPGLFELPVAGNNKVIKTYLEYSDTVSTCTQKDEINNDSSLHCSYEHLNFDTGYQHYNQNIGASIGMQAKSYTLGINAHKTSGTAAFAKLRHIKQTSQPTNAKQEESTRIQLDLGYQQGLFNGLLKVSGSVFKLDEEVASLMVAGFGGMVTKLTKDQADYINVPQDGPFKEESYKY